MSKLSTKLTFVTLILLISSVKTLKLNHYQNDFPPSYSHLERSQSTVFKGAVSLSFPQSTSERLDQSPNKAEYFVSFSQFTDGCKSKFCYYGWVSNYTQDGQKSMIGYGQKVEIPAVFEIGVNSRRDYGIYRHPKLGEVFQDIIQVATQQFQPTIRQNLQTQQDRTNYKFIPLDDFLKSQPKSDLLNIKPNFDIAFIASFSSPLSLKNIQQGKSNLKQQIAVDKQYNIVKRIKNVNVFLPTDSFADEKKKPDLVSDVKISFQKIGVQNIEQDEIRKRVQQIKEEFKERSYITAKAIEARRSEVSLYRQNLKTVDQFSKKGETILQKQINALAVSRISSLKNSCSITNTSGQISIFTYQKQLFSKTILGKKFSVTAKVQSTLVKGNSIRFKGLLIYNFFGSSKSSQVFNQLKSISINYQKSLSFSGAFSTSIYIPLPPPVSFIGINFAFSLTFSISATLYAKGSPQIVNCVYNFQIGADFGTQVGVGASAAIRVIAIQGGVYINGVLVNLSTDPKLAIAYNVQTKAVVPTVNWYFYIKAFKFQWGFFYRTWGWGGWSGKKIIAKWPISNGITQKYLVYKS